MKLPDTDPPHPWLNGSTVLVVEDETMVSFLIEDMLSELGCSTVLHASRVDQALALLREQRPDAAVLDVNLGGELGYPIAEELAAAEVPFVFSTGYGGVGIPPEWASRPTLQKPFSAEMLNSALQTLLPERSAKG